MRGLQWSQTLCDDLSLFLPHARAQHNQVRYLRRKQLLKPIHMLVAFGEDERRPARVDRASARWRFESLSPRRWCPSPKVLPPARRFTRAALHEGQGIGARREAQLTREVVRGLQHDFCYV